MSDFFKKFKNVFVVDDSKGKKVKSQANSSAKLEKVEKAIKTEPRANLTKGSSLGNSSNKSNSPSSQNAKIDPKFTKILLTALEKNDQDGYDYLEFKSTLKSLSSMDMDERTKYKSAEAMAKAMGVNVENIVRSADFYLQVLASEEKLFEDALKNQHREKVIGKQEGIADLKKRIDLSQKKIIELQDDIKQTQGQVNKAEAELTISLNKMNTTKLNFIKTYENMIDQIKEDRNNIIKFLK